MQIAVGTRGGGQRLEGQLPLAGLGFINLDDFAVEARPTGDLQMIAELACG
ncbi:hypothetical protein D3C81_2080450 [compost metagenome]